jgi:hypothetical protein
MQLKYPVENRNNIFFQWDFSTSQTSLQQANAPLMMTGKHG